MQINIAQKNPLLCQLFATLYYVSVITLAGLALLEAAKPGFVSFHFNLVWLVIFALVSGTLFSLFRIEAKNSFFSHAVFLLSLFMLFFIVGAHINVRFFNSYVLALFIIISLGLAFYIIRPSSKGE